VPAHIHGVRIRRIVMLEISRNHVILAARAGREGHMALVGIIGAGLAGLSTAKVMRQFGFEVIVFEREPDVGGVWSKRRRYPGLTTQNPRDTYAFSDWPMPRSYPEWPSGEQMQAYIESYVDHFGFRDRVHLGTEVLAARPHGEGWVLETRNAAGETGHTEVDWLVISNGIFSMPDVPSWPGNESFTASGGQILHTSQFTDAEAARGRHVLVIGYGKSSCDVANALVGTAASVTVVARHLIWKIPKLLAGKLNYKHLLLSRTGESLFRYIELKGFEKFLHGPGKPLRNAMLDSVQAVVTWQLKLREIGLHPEKPLETIARSTVSLVTEGFYENIAAGRLGFHKGAITRLEPGQAILDTGEAAPADLIICGTGWHQRCDFLPPEINARVTDSQGNFRLYRSMIPVDVPRLVFNGYNSSFFSQLNAEVGALWLAQYMRGAIPLPDHAAQNRYIDKRLAWMEARTDGKHAKGTNIIPFSIHHMDELLGDMDIELPLPIRLKHWLTALNAADYAFMTPTLLKRRNIAA
jgi:cation diffusion facilitator CzcD-associated flavoprotein CzcO